ncbi:MAG: aminopeptidase [Lachnospiraceae bacterium]|nr:aminopeptidase [Lachnospiraceae bacterium]
MSYQQIYKPYREEVRERYPLVMERIGRILEEETVSEPFRGYFRNAAGFVMKLYKEQEEISKGTFFNRSLSELAEWNDSIYGELYPGNYEKSFANPEYAVKVLGEEYGRELCMLYAQIRKMADYAPEGGIYEMTIYGELLVEIYNCFEDEAGVNPKEISNILYWFAHDYIEIFTERSICRRVNPEDDFFAEIIKGADLNDLRYLYRFGCCVGENEIKTAEFLNCMPQEKIKAMADTYTEGYRIGFEVTGKDLSKKRAAEISYPLGFERVVRAAMDNFEKMGLQVTFRRGDGRFGVYSASPNEQYDFDHKADAAAYLDKEFVEHYLECIRNSYESFKEAAAGYAGPAVIETFGREPFTPVGKKENYEFNEKQQKLNVYFSNKSGQLMNQYIKGEERSFTIIAYPIPEIGPKYEEIFEKTVELNNLDYTLYRDMQQKIIDVLDQAEYVKIKGREGNRTDLTVAICPLADPGKETAFENCVADVNIPVGEVFTSPKLAGTNGILHVSQVYLNQLKYVDLELEFTEGMITSYRCRNFSQEEENQKFLKEHLLYHHNTLPLGEFAIGTNTTAYRMGRDYNIADKLPILIAEKTGPHFAVGDTCYTWAEDTPVFNPDGKEIVARDNEISILRKEDPQKAYFNCHTDITIPYDELDTITIWTRDGREIPVIAEGRYVVEGTEALNVPLEQQHI